MYSYNMRYTYTYLPIINTPKELGTIKLSFRESNIILYNMFVYNIHLNLFSSH